MSLCVLQLDEIKEATENNKLCVFGVFDDADTDAAGVFTAAAGTTFQFTLGHAILHTNLLITYILALSRDCDIWTSDKIGILWSWKVHVLCGDHSVVTLLQVVPSWDSFLGCTIAH